MAPERERRHDGRTPGVGGLLGLGRAHVRVAEALERDAHPNAGWLADSRRVGSGSIAFEPSGGALTQSKKLPM